MKKTRQNEFLNGVILEFHYFKIYKAIYFRVISLNSVSLFSMQEFSKDERIVANNSKKVRYFLPFYDAMEKSEMHVLSLKNS